MRDRGRRRDGFARTRREPFARRRARGDEGVVRRRCHGARLREDVAAIRRRRRQARRRRRAQHGRRGRDARGEDFRDRIRCERLGVDARGIGFDRYRRGERDEGAPGDGRARRRETDDVRVARGCVSLVRDARRRDEKSAFGVVIAAFAVARDGRRRVDVARRLARHRAVLAIVVRRAVQTLSRRKGAEAAFARRKRSFRHRTDDRTDARQISDDPVAERRARDSGGRPRIRRQRARKFSREVRVSSAPDAAVVPRDRGAERVGFGNRSGMMSVAGATKLSDASSS
mmetsp:Transcript_8124/g.32479  ORF Transcript_8124/g.32479 Transcript_8124/m.32479 type:complete len:286 (-) Transcript_8124:1102-1959(-)